MSFLFTFRLPRLPFPNPFATLAAEEENTRQINLATDANDNLHLHDSEASRVPRAHAQYPSTSQHFQDEGGPIANPRKRNRTSLQDHRYTIPTRNAYHDEPRNTLFESALTRTRPSTRGEYEYDFDQDAEEDERPGKRRKLGIAETILATAVSVAIVSTAVGYTAYRLWRDGGTSGKTKDDDTEALDTKKDSTADWQDSPAREGNNNHNISGIPSPPPPPYYASYEDSWTGSGEGRPQFQGGRGEASTSIIRTEGRHSSQQDYSGVRPGSKRGPMAKVHRTLKTSSSPRSGGHQTARQHEDEDLYVRRRVHGSGFERDERLASSTGRKPDGWRSMHNSGAPSRHTRINTRGHRSEMKRVAVVRSDSEEYEEGSSRLEEQMNWMSERLQGLIADGKKALGREIVVAEGVADSALHGDLEDETGHLDDGEGGWEDAENNGIDPTPATMVARHPGARISSTRETPRKQMGYAARKELPYTSVGSKNYRTGYSRNHDE